ncbi:hypothetical protein Elgi_67250 [Paenibacillus elgii]|nr:hypothetical protein Elgi_67250 [Paenibacillus elgii]
MNLRLARMMARWQQTARSERKREAVLEAHRIGDASHFFDLGGSFIYDDRRRSIRRERDIFA